MTGDATVRVRISRGFSMVNAELGVRVGHGQVVAVPAATAREWLRQGWAEPLIEQPGDPAA